MSGDIYRRVKTGPDTYACGCRWERWKRRDVFGNGSTIVNGDVLIECELHAAASAARLRRLGEIR